MKKLLLLLLVFAGFLACENESIEELPQEVSKTEGITAKKNQKVDVCHKGKIINVSVNALGGHQGHGDAIDWDGDGYFDIENDCSEVDCDDSNPAINPDAIEVCDGIDNNCDGLIDEGVKTTYYADTDEDGYGDSLNSTDACSVPSGYVSDNSDCDDNNAEVNPGVVEVCNGIDDNCNGATDENCNPCLDDAINQVSNLIIVELGGTDLSSTITDSNTFLIFWNSNGRDGRDCIETTAEVTGDPETGCGYVNLHHESVPCP